MELNCLLPYEGDAFFKASLAAPVSCIIGAFKTNYHYTPGTYVHQMGLRPGGAMAVLAGAGPMGLSSVDLALNDQNRPAVLVVTDIDQGRLDRAAARGMRLDIPAGTAATVQAIVSTGSVGISDAMMAALPRLSLFCCYGTGYERVD